MKVYNVTDAALSFRGKEIPPGQGLDFPELDRFLPDRERAMVAKRVIAIGQLPAWYTVKRAVPTSSPKPVQLPARAVVKAVSHVKLEGGVEVKTTEAPTPAVVLPEERELSDGWRERPVGSKSKLR
jgi:hypothetical protein